MENSDRDARSGSYPYISPVPGRIPVVAFNPWVSRKDKKWQEAPGNTFKVLGRCGFNTAVLHVPEEGILSRAFSLARESGIPCILQHYTHSLNNVMETLVERFKDEPNLGAFELKDEPPFFTLGIPQYTDARLDWQEGEVREIYDTLRRIIIRDRLNLMVFMNLAYYTDRGNFGNYPTYMDYLKKIQGAYRPAMWSYDVYPIISKDGATYTDQTKFYNAFNDFMQISGFSKRPFWAFCMSMQYTKYDKSSKLEHSRPAPTIGNLRYEAFSALACGAQGIVYWAYAQTEDNSSEKQLTAPIDRQGSRTDVWFNARQVNSEIARYTDVFLGCTVVNVFTKTGRSNDSASRTLHMFGPFNNIGTDADKGVICSRIKNSGFEYLVIVSKDPFHSQELIVVYEKDYPDSYDVLEMTPNFLSEATIDKPAAPSTTRRIALEPGGYAIIRWKAK